MFKDITIRNATVNDIDLIRELTFKVWPQTYSSSISKEQIDYMLEMMYSKKSLADQIAEGSKFIIVQDNKEPVGFASYKPKDTTTYKLDKSRWLVGSSSNNTSGLCKIILANSTRILHPPLKFL